jgi:hypothetical protein
MEDLNDNLPTEGKRYYLSHTEYVLTKTNPSFDVLGGEVFKLTQLVCATNAENARKAIINQIEKNNNKLIIQCRVDYLIVGA